MTRKISRQTLLRSETKGNRRRSRGDICLLREEKNYDKLQLIFHSNDCLNNYTQLCGGKTTAAVAAAATLVIQQNTHSLSHKYLHKITQSNLDRCLMTCSDRPKDTQRHRNERERNYTPGKTHTYPPTHTLCGASVSQKDNYRTLKDMGRNTVITAL